ncbi:MAG: hypothetical protein CMP22_03785 [Rickettsiales bacterium]|nr:hypothetical protein [Rickettsiales bacterium]|tara:strand:+ start:209 stop:883 length:675 start_codon:yes stop_codon:yes gene_type:complete
MGNLTYEQRLEKTETEHNALRNYFTSKSIGSALSQVAFESISQGLLTLPFTIGSMIVGHIGRNWASFDSYHNEDGNLFFMTGSDFTEALENRDRVLERLPQNKEMTSDAVWSGLMNGAKRTLAPFFHFALLPAAAIGDGIGYGLKAVNAAGYAAMVWDKNNLKNAKEAMHIEFHMTLFNSTRELGYELGVLCPTETQVMHSKENSIVRRNRMLEKRYGAPEINI